MTGRISKIGDGGVRTALCEAANIILTRPVTGQVFSPTKLRRQPANALTEGDCRFGRLETPAARSKVPSPGRWIRSDRMLHSGGARMTAAF